MSTAVGEPAITTKLGSGRGKKSPREKHMACRVRSNNTAVVGAKKTTCLVGLEHAVEPRQQLLGAVVGVQHDGDAVELGHLSYVERHGDGPRDGGLLLGLLVVDALAGEESGTAVRHLVS